tara:strand:- start:985 stop:1308 length:324 start_codon:yes stop_codon:yes gene_type:complete
MSLLDRIASDSGNIFGSLADGAVEATITPDGGTAGFVWGSFRTASEQLDAGGAAIVDGGPIFVCAAADVSTVIAGDPCVIDSVTYYVMRKETPGFGSAQLNLSKDAV